MTNRELLAKLKELRAVIDRVEFRGKDNGPVTMTRYTVRSCVFDVVEEIEQPKKKK